MENEEKLREYSRSMQKALKEVIARCEKAGIEYRWSGERVRALFGVHALVVYVQQGPSKREIILFDAEDVDRLLDSDFEKYVFVEGYDAICCYEEGCVEAVVGLIGATATKALILSRLTGRDYEEVVQNIKAGKDVSLELSEGGNRGLRILIGNPSKTLLAMGIYYFDEEEELSVRVEGLRITKNTEAAELLGRVTNSLFFELKSKRNVGLFVKRHYEVEIFAWPIGWSTKGRRKSEVSFPRYEYERQPIELYWHAVSAYKMPLLQYLAYYQILEYYFMKYSMLDAKKEISNCLKDPDFNADDDNDIMEIVTCVSGRLGPYISEKEFLFSTIQGCISEKDLASVVSGEGFKEYFKKEYKKYHNTE